MTVKHTWSVLKSRKDLYTINSVWSDHSTDVMNFCNKQANKQINKLSYQYLKLSYERTTYSYFVLVFLQYSDKLYVDRKARVTHS